jgi:hypothetical protein
VLFAVAAAARVGVAGDAAVAAGFGRVTAGVAVPPDADAVATGAATDTVGVDTACVETFAGEEETVDTGVATEAVGVETVADGTDAVATGVATETVGVVSAGEVDTFAPPLPIETVATGVAADTVGVDGLPVEMETAPGVVTAGATSPDDPEPVTDVRDVRVVPRAAPEDPDATRNAPRMPATKQTTRIDRIGD